MNAMAEVGQILLGKYRVERELGRGGMGVVLAVRHLDLDELQALKLLRPDALGSEGALNRFALEARAGARLKGEHVVRVHDIGRLEGGIPYILMEHLEGRSLASLLRGRGALPEEEAALYLLQACKALGEAHALGIVHRDIKPANLFLTRRADGSPCVKVLDFGVAKQLMQGIPELTMMGELLGTLNYMSPEQIVAKKPIDGRSDIWALGVVLYELTTGKRLFTGSPPQVIAQVLADPPRPPSAVRPGLSGVLDAAVARCLQRRPEDRFQSTDALGAALGGVLVARGGELAAAAPPESERAATLISEGSPGATAATWTRTKAERPAAPRGRVLVTVACAALGIGISGYGVWRTLASSKPATNAPAAGATAAAFGKALDAAATVAASAHRSDAVASATGAIVTEAATTASPTAPGPPPATSAASSPVVTGSALAPPRPPLPPAVEEGHAQAVPTTTANADVPKFLLPFAPDPETRSKTDRQLF